MFKLNNDLEEDFNSLLFEYDNMGVGLSVYRLLNPDRNNLLKNVSTKTQLTWQDFMLVSKISDATSNLRFLNYNPTTEQVEYEALHYSDTIRKPVRVFLDDIQESVSEIAPAKVVKGRSKIVDNGYQVVYKFKVVIDFKTNEIFVFTKKDVADHFMSRFAASGKIEYGILYLNLSKVDELPEINNVWGVWEDGTGGRCKKKAYFGTEVHKEAGVEKELVTSYNVLYEYDEGFDIDLFIDSKCKISTNSKLFLDEDLLRVYEVLKAKLGFRTSPEETTRTSQEQE